jgi:hypothetical protein
MDYVDLWQHYKEMKMQILLSNLVRGVKIEF